jgi:hypothetical protein
MQAGAHTTEVLKQLLPSLAQSEVMLRFLLQKCAFSYVIAVRFKNYFRSESWDWQMMHVGSTLILAVASNFHLRPGAVIGRAPGAAHLANANGIY